MLILLIVDRLDTNSDGIVSRKELKQQVKGPVVGAGRPAAGGAASGRATGSVSVESAGRGKGSSR